MPGLQFAPCLDRLSLAFLRRVMHLGKSAFIKFVFIQNQRKLPTQKRLSNTIAFPLYQFWKIGLTQIICVSTTAEETQRILHSMKIELQM